MSFTSLLVMIVLKQPEYIFLIFKRFLFGNCYKNDIIFKSYDFNKIVQWLRI